MSESRAGSSRRTNCLLSRFLIDPAVIGCSLSGSYAKRWLVRSVDRNIEKTSVRTVYTATRNGRSSLVHDHTRTIGPFALLSP